MAFTINIYYTGEGDAARKFAEEMTSSGIVDRIRAEKGNLGYEYFLPLDDAETVLLIDTWIDQDALDSHHGSPMMDDIAKLRDKYDLHMRVERYQEVTDPDASKDKEYIRN